MTLFLAFFAIQRPRMDTWKSTFRKPRLYSRGISHLTFFVDIDSLWFLSHLQIVFANEEIT